MEIYMSLHSIVLKFLKLIQRKTINQILNSDLIHFTPILISLCRTGKIELEIEFPSKQVTSVIFGGDNLDELYVTTGRFTLFGAVTEDDGYLYKATGLGVSGLDGVKVRGLKL